MYGNYTQAACDRCFNVLDEDIYVIWDAIESLSDDETATQWREKCMKLAKEYSFSSRLAIIRILCSRSQNCGLGHADTSKGFSFEFDGEKREFKGSGMEQLESLGAEEIAEYEDILCQIAETRPDAEEDAARTEYLAAKAMRDVDQAVELALAELDGDTPNKEKQRKKKEAKTLLSRKEALELGHILGFSLKEMNWFLLRVYDFEDSFRYNYSGDLVEAYGFLIDASPRHVNEIAEKYKELSKDIQKADTSGRDSDWTRNVSVSLVDLVEKWSVYPDSRDGEFLNWMMKQAPFLDQPSRTATGVYRRIAMYIYGISTGSIPMPDSRMKFIGELYRLSENSSEAIEMDFAPAKEVSAYLLENNKNIFTSAADRSKAWRTVSSNENGLPCLTMAGRPDAKRNRVQELLTGAEQVEKGDMLHLLWFGFNLYWETVPIEADMFELQCNLADFIETASDILDKALLPAFYPPHMMEQSMMLSIIASVEDCGLPAYNYAELCESLIAKRNRVSKKNKNA